MTLITHQCNGLRAFDDIAGSDQQEGAHTVSMEDLNQIAIATMTPSGISNGSIRYGDDRSANRIGNIDSIAMSAPA